MVFKTIVPQTTNKRVKNQKGALLGPSIRSRLHTQIKHRCQKKARGVDSGHNCPEVDDQEGKSNIHKVVEIWVPVAYRERTAKLTGGKADLLFTVGQGLYQVQMPP